MLKLIVISLLFVDVWNALMLSLQVSFKWKLVKLEDNLLRWKDLFPLLMDIPFDNKWEIWRASNLATFQGIQLAVE